MHVPKLHWILVEDSEQKTGGLQGGCAIHSSHLTNVCSESSIKSSTLSLTNSLDGFRPISM